MIAEILDDIVGPFPEKTPLNPVIVRTITREGYRVEHIIYESQPGFYVTSSMYIPVTSNKGEKLPVIIYCSGHTVEGYRSSVYQHVILNLVNKGFIVFAFDPVGQGERLEYFDPGKGESSVGGPTKEHSYPGAQAFITGSSQARFMIWDGIRAVDYLLTRREVDTSRIGITGRSGGGTQSAYIAAMDDRIYAAAPENYITNYKRLLQTIGPQDAEQNLFNLIQRGLDHPDFLIVRAPLPTLMITTTGDMFSIQGALETEKEVSGIYKAYGKEENFSRVEDDAGHASTVKNREAMYAFFQKHLKNPGNPLDEVIPPLTAEELQVTRTGQISTSLTGETVFSLNKKLAENAENQLRRQRENSDVFLPEVITAAKKLSGYKEPEIIDEPIFTGRIKRDKYIIDKYFLKGEGDYIIPFLLFKPDIPSDKTIIYLHPSGKSAEAHQGGEIEWFVFNGFNVLAPDIVGTGEVGPGILRGDAYFSGVSHNLWYASILIGRSICGIQAADVVRLARLINKQNDDSGEIFGFARSEMASVMLHAAAFSSEFSGIMLFNPCGSFLSLVMNRNYDPVEINSTVPAALTAYDLPDLAAAIAPLKLFIASITDISISPSEPSYKNRDIEIVKSSYQQKQAGGQLCIVTGKSNEKTYGMFKDLINKN
jgi:hypothetical protein